MDIAHWEFIGLLFGLALALVEMSGWEMNRYLRHGIGIAGVLLAGACIVLLFGFSGATLRSPISFRWPVVLPSDKAAPAPVPIVRAQFRQAATPTPINLAELEALKADNTKLKAENARLRKAKTPHVAAAALPMPSACPSLTPILFPSKISAADCDALTGAQRLVDSADRDRIEAIKSLIGMKTNEQIQQATIQGLAAKATEEQAMSNLANLQARLCVEVVVATPAPTGH